MLPLLHNPKIVLADNDDGMMVQVAVPTGPVKIQRLEYPLPLF